MSIVVTANAYSSEKLCYLLILVPGAEIYNYINCQEKRRNNPFSSKKLSSSAEIFKNPTAYYKFVNEIDSGKLNFFCPEDISRVVFCFRCKVIWRHALKEANII